MAKLTSPRRVRELLEQYGLQPRKLWGQNFLVDENILHKILESASLKKSDCVLEIGPGLGALTKVLAERIEKVLAVEIDEGLFGLLRDILADYPNIKLVQADIRKINLRQFCQKEWGAKEIKVVANLPYYLTTPFLFQLLQEGPPLKQVVLMVQREVAERIVAPPGSPDYGILSILCLYYTEPELLFKVPRSVFLPSPAVDSAVVRLSARSSVIDVGNENLFWKLLRGVFQQRRKTILKSLLSVFALSREEGTRILEKSGIDPQSRPQTISLEQFAMLARLLYNL